MTNSLIANAVLSIAMGVEDFQSDQQGRSLSSIRNIYAGVLLLCKEVLVRHSPGDSESVLIKSNIIPTKQKDSTVKLVGKGRKTVDLRQIRERFEGLDLSLDWKRLDRIANIRNEVEHYFTEKPEPLIREAVSDAFVLIHKLVTDHLNEMPIALLGKRTWQALLEANDVFEKQRAACVGSFEVVHFRSETLARASSDCICPSCGSSLIMQLHETNADEYLIELLCSACGAVPERDDVLEAAIVNELEFDNYVSLKETNELALENCPECSRETYVAGEDLCALCGFSLNGMKCSICSTTLTIEEYQYSEKGMCSYCYHKMTKDD